MTTDPIAAAASSAASTTTPGSTDQTNNNANIGEDAFLQLLVTQMQYQDPLQPEDNTEFLSQLAQFTSVQSLESIKDNTASLLSVVQTGTDAADAAIGATTDTLTGDPAAINQTSAS